jgi:outer membrane protein OmpU
MNIKKIGLTALAGSLIAATTGYAGELTLSGSAKMSYKTIGGSANAAATQSSGFAMDQEMSASGSAELDNGMTISLSHGLATGGSGSDTSSLTLDMGDMGSITYNDTDLGNGLRALKDMSPRAYEDAIDGITGADPAQMGSGQGFAYNNSFAGAAVSLVYSDNLAATTNRSDGGQDATVVGASSSTSIGIQYPVGDTGLTLFGGTGTQGGATAALEIDHETVGLLYAFGPMTASYQQNDLDRSGALEDLKSTIFGVSFSVNDNLSISYASHETESSTAPTLDAGADGISVAYSMGGMTLSVYHNDADNVGNVANTTADATEMLLSFAF